MPLIPRIVGDWQLLYKPERTGCYVNDHCIVRATDGMWHLFGITRDGPEIMPDYERYFTHGSGKSLISENGFDELGIVCNNGWRAWAPAVVRHNDRYHMFYGPAPMRYATADELTHWMENPVHLIDAPLDSCHRDQMVIQHEDRWLMYATGIADRCGVISVFESNDLQHWRFIRYALRTTREAPRNPPWGATESPFVVAIDSAFYLFITYTDCAPNGYHDTLVFRSEDPTDFGTYTGNNATETVTQLHAHAPEVIQDDDGQWYITSCGWRGCGTVIEGGVGIAPILWEE